MKTMNERDKNEMLNAVAGEGETYQCRLWGTIMADAKTYAKIGGLSLIAGSGAAALGALSNAYCYLGMTEKSINFVIIDSIDVSKIKNRLSIPVGSITKAEVKKGLIPGRTTVILHIENAKMKLALMNNTVGSDIKGQKENVEKFCQLVKNI
jgi:hypothetical protein